MDDALWTQFRRLLLGTVIELLRDADIDVDLRTLDLEFDRSSRFQVPRLNNYMRFVGRVEGVADAPLDDDAVQRLQDRLDRLWPDLCGVVVLPIGDNLTPTRNDIGLTVDGGFFALDFDLEAD